MKNKKILKILDEYIIFAKETMKEAKENIEDSICPDLPLYEEGGYNMALAIKERFEHRIQNEKTKRIKSIFYYKKGTSYGNYSRIQ